MNKYFKILKWNKIIIKRKLEFEDVRMDSGVRILDMLGCPRLGVWRGREGRQDRKVSPRDRESWVVRRI